MRKLFFSVVCLMAMATLHAQEKNDNHRNDLINTIKERIQFKGYIQAGYTYDDEKTTTNTFDIKRAIVWGTARITDRWTAQLMYNFGGTVKAGAENNTAKILELWTDYRFLPGLTFRIGQFKTPFTIENPMSPTTLETIACNAQIVSHLLGGQIGSHGGRDLGIMIYGDLFNQIISYHLALMQGQGLNVKDGNNQKDFVAKLGVRPADWLLISASVMQGKGHAVSTSAYTDIAVGEDYRRDRWSIGAELKTKPLSLRTEYLSGKDGKARIDGCYATAAIHVLPKLDVIASYDYLNRNHDMGAEESHATGGVQYWFYPKCRLQAQYVYRDKKSGEASNAILAQVQVAF